LKSRLYIDTPRPICLLLLRQVVCCAFVFALASAGRSIAARIAMIAITTRSSISVKAPRSRGYLFRGVMAYECLPTAPKFGGRHLGLRQSNRWPRERQNVIHSVLYSLRRLAFFLIAFQPKALESSASSGPKCAGRGDGLEGSYCSLVWYLVTARLELVISGHGSKGIRGVDIRARF